MPCDQVRRLSVEFGENTNLEVLQKTLEAKGYTVTRSAGYISFYDKDYNSGSFDQRTGKFTYDERMKFDVNQVKDEYQKQNVIHHAEEHGWQWDREVNEAGNDVIKIRRSY